MGLSDNEQKTRERMECASSLSPSSVPKGRQWLVVHTQKHPISGRGAEDAARPFVRTDGLARCGADRPVPGEARVTCQRPSAPSSQPPAASSAEQQPSCPLPSRRPTLETEHLYFQPAAATACTAKSKPHRPSRTGAGV